MPDWLWWLSPVLLAPVATMAWTAWSGRERGPEQPADSMRDYERFRTALGTPLPGQQRPPGEEPQPVRLRRGPQP